MRRAPIFTPSDRRAILTFTFIMAVITAVVWWYSSLPPSEQIIAEPVEEIEFDDSIKRVMESHHHRYKPADPSARPFPFNPNTADSATFVRLGLSSWISGRICHYRAAGGKFRRKEDLQKIYGLSRDDYQRLEAYIRIPSSTSDDLANARWQSDPVATYDTTDYPRKFRQKTVVDLNTADSVTLMRVPGIGSYFAGRILHYRNRLGGYVSASQLREIKNFPEETISWFTAGSRTPETLRINHLTFRELLRHPYINYEQTKAICNYRDKFGPIHNLQELSNYDAFTASDLSRLEPYVRFD